MLAAHLAQLLARHLGLAARLFGGLVGDEALRDERLGPLHLLLGQVEARRGGLDIGVDARARLRCACVGALDIGAQLQQRLPVRTVLPRSTSMRSTTPTTCEPTSAT